MSPRNPRTAHQLSLPGCEVPIDEAALRAAWRQVPKVQAQDIEWALQDETICRCLRRIAQAQLRRRR